MLQFQQDHRFFLFHSDLRLPHQSDFFSPDYWQTQGRIAGTAKGRGTTYFLNTADLFGVNTALRHYYRGGLWGKINRDWYWFRTLATTRSIAEFTLLDELHHHGMPVPKPIGAMVYRSGCGYRADILTQKIDNAADLTDLLQQTPLPDDIWRQIGGLIRRLHDLQICHTDLNAHNILVQNPTTDAQCWLIDFDKCGRKSGHIWKAANLQRLHRSFQKEIRRLNIHFMPENWQTLLTGYEQN